MSLSLGELQSRVVRGSVWTVLNVAVAVPLGIVANAITARILGPSAYGSVAFLIAAYTFALPLTELGFGAAFVQWAVAAESSGDGDGRDRLIRARVGFGLLIQTPLMWAAGLLFLGGQSIWVIAVYLLSVPCIVAGIGCQSVLLLQNRTAATAKTVLVGGVITQVGVVLVAMLTKDAGPVWAARVGLSILTPALAAFYVTGALRRVALRPRVPRDLPPGFWRFALFSWVAGASAVLVYSRSEVLVMRFYHLPVQLGLFAVAFGISQQLTAPLDSLLAPLFPANAALLAGHVDDVQRAFLRSVRFFALLAGGLVALVPAVYYVTPLTFGDKFAGSASLFLPLGLASTFQSLASPVILLTLARRRGGLFAGAFVAALVVDLAVAFPAIAVWGAWGAVIANIAGQLASIGILSWYELRRQGTRLAVVASAGRSWFFGVAAATFGLLVGEGAAGPAGPVAAVIAAAFGGLVVYWAILRIDGGVLTEGDADALLRIVPARARHLAGRLLGFTVSNDVPA